MNSQQNKFKIEKKPLLIRDSKEVHFTKNRNFNSLKSLSLNNSRLIDYSSYYYNYIYKSQQNHSKKTKTDKIPIIHNNSKNKDKGNNDSKYKVLRRIVNNNLQSTI